jgi:hypothetical protein
MKQNTIHRELVRAVGRLLPVCLLPLMPLSVTAQKLEVAKTTIDVGKTGYQKPITAVFEFKNKSMRHLRIESVLPDCHCTSVDYPRQDIAVGESFQVKMTYNARQLGHFDHQAAFVSNATTKPVYLRMKGVVLADLQDFSGTYPIEMGDLLLDSNELEFDDVNKGDVLTRQLHIYNNGTRVYNPLLMHLPDYLSAQVVPERLPPGRTATVTLTLNSAHLHDYGLTQTDIYLAGNPGDNVSPDHAINISTVVLPSFTGMTPEMRQNAPRLQLSKEVVDIVFDGKSKRSDVIELTNHGHTELNITSLQLFTGGLRISLGKRRLSPGETTKLKITAMRDELSKVRTKPRVLMITNDPAKPKVTITINAK